MSSSALDMKLPGFLMGDPSSASHPHKHWSHVTLTTPFSPKSFSITSVCHDVAYAGCSRRRQLPPMICSRYNPAYQSKCSLALLSSLATIIGSRILLLMRCHVENAVHMGEPTKS